MLFRPHTRKRLTIAAVAMIAAAVVVAPAGATSQPAAECPAPQVEMVARATHVAALAPHQQAKLLARVEHAREAMKIRLTETLEMEEAARIDVQFAATEIADIELTYLIDETDLRAAAWMDRDQEAFAARWEQEWRHLDFEPQPRASHPLTAGIHMLVDIAQLPARASLVAQHVIEAFAKVTPRVVRALL